MKAIFSKSRTLSALPPFVLLAGLAIVACAPKEATSARNPTLAALTDETERPSEKETTSVEEIGINLPGLAGKSIPGAKVLTQGLQLRYDRRSPRFFVIINEDAWVDFWRTYAPEGRTTAPSVDFGVSFVLVGIQGVKSTGGYSITFSAVQQKGRKVHVITDLQEPAGGESVEMAFTQPYIIVKAESARLTTRGRLTFIFETTTGQELGRVTQSIHLPVQETRRRSAMEFRSNCTEYQDGESLPWTSAWDPAR